MAINEVKEAKVFVRVGSPWICTCCPNCGTSVSSAWGFCAKCGQAMSFEHYRRVQQIGGPESVTRGGVWVECVATDKKLCKEYFIKKLEELEKQCLVSDEDGTLKIMRDAYLKTCFGE